VTSPFTLGGRGGLVSSCFIHAGGFLHGGGGVNLKVNEILRPMLNEIYAIVINYIRDLFPLQK
jgi:hypothetical protein